MPILLARHRQRAEKREVRQQSATAEAIPGCGNRERGQDDDREHYEGLSDIHCDDCRP
jgi:hypothetical protein